MDPLHALALALIQGITEFLPISSSAHLILPSKLLGWPDQGLAFDTAVHLGSLTAVIVYFRHELSRLTAAVILHIQTRQPSADSHFALNLMLASLPIIPIGYFTRFIVETELRGVEVIAFTTIVFGIALWVADSMRGDTAKPLTPARSIAIGLAQCLALIPGTSRSGVTITMALLLGQSREHAARISFLIAIPAISGAAVIKLWDLLHTSITPDWFVLGIATGVAGLSAYFCIVILLNIVNKIGYLPFVIYRIGLGSLLLWMIY
ncbi:MAG: undecaprenyl-diphosphate phosphatase [Gammaproteobacteria bacterium]|nr:undecaprenyl-diphosphate phosphatase [Gammaproteobacteria bacterium]